MPDSLSSQERHAIDEAIQSGRVTVVPPRTSSFDDDDWSYGGRAWAMETGEGVNKMLKARIKKSKKREEMVRRLANGQHTRHEIAAKTGLAYNTVTTIVLRHGLAVREVRNGRAISRDEMQALCDRGFTRYQMAVELQTSVERIDKLAKEYGLKIPVSCKVGSAKRISDEKRAKMTQMAEDGVPIKEIARQVDMTYHAVHKALERWEVKVKAADGRAPISDADRAEVIRRHQAGHSMPKISDDLRIPILRVRYAIRKWREASGG